MAGFNFSPRALRYIERRMRELAVPPATPAPLTPRVTAHSLIHDIDLDTYALELRFSQVGDTHGSLTIPRSLIASPHNVVLQLLDAGALLPSDRKHAADLVQRSLAEPARLSRSVTRRGGWHNDSFVTSGGTFGPQTGHLRFVASKVFEDKSIGMRSGTFANWREGMQEACASSSFLTFGLGLGYGGPLLDVLREDEGAIFNLFGQSSSGKSLVGRCVHSQAGRAQKSDMPTYDISPRGAEELCFARNDWVVILDEQGRTKGSPEQRREKERNLAFMIPSGRGQIRSARVSGTHDLPNLSWRVLGLTSGEKPLENQGTRRVAGEQLRHIDISVPRIHDGGVFDLIDGEQEAIQAESARLADLLEANITWNYGLARGRYLERLTVERTAISPVVRRMVDEFVEEVGASTQSWERRFARKFGIVAAGAMLAADWDVAPFSTEHGRQCVLSVYRRARSSIFSVSEEIIDIQCALRKAVEEGRFPQLPKGGTLSENEAEVAWGFRRHEDGHDIVAVLPEKFNDLASSRPSATAVLDKLIEKGDALPGTEGKRHRQISATGFPRVGRGRWVCLLASRLI